MKQYRLIKFDIGCPNGFCYCGVVILPIDVGSPDCKKCPHYRGTSGQRVKCSFGIDEQKEGYVI